MSKNDFAKKAKKIGRLIYRRIRIRAKIIFEFCCGERCIECNHKKTHYVKVGEITKKVCSHCKSDFPEPISPHSYFDEA